MCRMIAAPLGILGERIVEPFVRMACGKNALHEHNTTLGEFNHPDGWGAVYKEKGSFELYRNVQPCWKDSELARFKERKIFIIHARRASRGQVNLGNVHPFTLEHNGKSRCFCHNGTIDDRAIADYAGETDSERYFRFLLHHLDMNSPLASIKAAVNTLHDYSPLNAFLTDGDHLYVINRYTKAPRYYTLFLHQGSDGPIISSEALLDVATDWEPLANGKIITYEAHTKRNTLITSLDQ